MQKRHLVATVTAVALATLSAGCSGSSTPPSSASTAGSPIATAPNRLSATSYRAALHQVARKESAAQHKVQAAFSAHTVGDIRSALASFASDQRQVAARLQALHPPADAITANAQLASAFSENAMALQKLLTQLAGVSSVKRALSIVQNDKGGQSTGQRIDAALSALHKLGYTAGS
jgi:hypothetical protein